MKTLTDWQAKRDEARTNADRLYALAALPPAVPDRISLNGKRPAILSYDRPTLADAAALFESFGDKIVEIEDRKAGCRSLMPQPWAGGGELMGIYGVLLRVWQLPTHLSISVEFFARLAPDSAGETNVVHISVHLPNRHTYAPRAIDTLDRAGRVETRKYAGNSDILGVADSCISWTTGDNKPVKTSADHTYLFEAELASTEFGDRSSADYSTALRDLRKLSAMLDK